MICLTFKNESNFISSCSDTIISPQGFNISSYFWDFGDGNTSSLFDPNTISTVFLSPGDYTISLSVIDDNSCQSTSSNTISISNTSTTYTDTTICDSSYDWNGSTYSSTGTFTYSTVNEAGCDSIVILNLTINNSTSSITDVTSCDSYDWNGNSYTTSGVYTFNTINSLG